MESSTKKMKSTSEQVDPATTMGNLKYTVLKNYGTDSLTQENILDTLMKLTHYTETTMQMIVILLTIVLYSPNAYWTSMVNPNIWRKHKLYTMNLEFWEENKESLEEWEKILVELKLMSSGKSLAKLQMDSVMSLGGEPSSGSLIYLSVSEIMMFVEFCKSYTTQPDNMVSPAPSTSSLATETMFTSAIPADTQEDTADVPSWLMHHRTGYVDDREFVNQYLSSNSQRQILHKSLPIYLTRSELSKKWVGTVPMEDYVINIDIYQYVLKQFIRSIDRECFVEANRCMDYIRTGMPGKRYVHNTKYYMFKKYHQYDFKNTLDYIYRTLNVENDTLACFEELLYGQRFSCIETDFIVEHIHVLPSMFHCNICTFMHRPCATYKEIHAQYPLLNKRTIEYIVNCSIL